MKRIFYHPWSIVFYVSILVILFGVVQSVFLKNHFPGELAWLFPSIMTLALVGICWAYFMHLSQMVKKIKSQQMMESIHTFSFEDPHAVTAPSKESRSLGIPLEERSDIHATEPRILDKDCKLILEIFERFAFLFKQYFSINDKKHSIYNTFVNQIHDFSTIFRDIQKEFNDQSVLITISSTALEEFINSIELISKNVEHTMSISYHLVESSQKGIQNVERTIKLTQEIEQMGKEIEAITNIIGNVAEKTHVLSINAAIESARAHHLGRGFSVVAQEIRKLAQDTNKATVHIRNMTKTMYQAIQNEVELMKENETIFSSINKGVNETNALIQEISRSITDKQENIQHLKQWSYKLLRFTQHFESLIKSQEMNLSVSNKMFESYSETNKYVTEIEEQTKQLDLEKQASTLADLGTFRASLESQIELWMDVDSRLGELLDTFFSLQRKSTRIEIPIPMSLIVQRAFGKEEKTNVTTVNISLNGALCESSVLMEKNTPIRFIISLNGEKEDGSPRHYSGSTIHGRGRVISSNPVEAGNRRSFRTAVSFDELSLEHQSYLTAFLYY